MIAPSVLIVNSLSCKFLANASKKHLYTVAFVPRSKRKGRYIPVPAAQEKRLVLKNRVCLVPRLEAE